MTKKKILSTKGKITDLFPTVQVFIDDDNDSLTFYRHNAQSVDQGIHEWKFVAVNHGGICNREVTYQEAQVLMQQGQLIHAQNDDSEESYLLLPPQLKPIEVYNLWIPGREDYPKDMKMDFLEAVGVV